MSAVRGTTRALVWAALLAGIAASLAANIAHAHDGTGPRLASAWAPVALLLAVSVAERAPRPARWWFAALEYAGIAVVALVAALVSYQHQRDLLAGYGETRLSATLLPLSVDGLIVVASMALIAMGEATRTAEDDTALSPAAEQLVEQFRAELDAVPSPPVPLADDAQDGEDEQVPDPDPLLTVARRLVAEGELDGRPLTRDGLAADLRGAGHPVATGRATDLYRQIRDERAA